MGPLDLLWHGLGLFAVPLLFGLLAATGARLLWRRRFAARPWRRVLAAACASAAAVTLAGLLVFGRDGRMATYLLMVLAVAAVLGWLGRRGA
ncbi:MAG: hypothetical protein AMXMBFR78_00330 [Rubrivivax sp.]|jgi:hypothetical protein